jgi:protein arginine kinase
MSIESLIARDPVWQEGGNASHAGTVILSQCNAGRNLRDVPFPAASGPDEREGTEERLVGVFEKLDLLSAGEYFRLSTLRPSELQLLAERQLITLAMTTPRKGQGVFISDDQCLAILVNDEDHCCIRVLAAGLGLREAWNRLNALDDQLNDILAFAYSDRFGYLTRNLCHTGTGLKLSVLLHLPACAHESLSRDGTALQEIRLAAEKQDLDFSGVGTGMPEKQPGSARQHGDRWPVSSQALYNNMGGYVTRGLHEAEGDLFQLRNRSTLGHSEEELVLRLKQAAGEIIRREAEQRQRLRDECADLLEDRVERARALATNARLIPFDESFTLLSSLRLGVTLGLISDRTVADLNGSLIHCQGAHVERQLQPGVDTVDELSLKRLRARQFKRLFTPVQG